MSHHAIPVGGPILTDRTKWLLWAIIIGGAAIAWRFAVGLGPVTGLNDGYPWGLWIAFDVVTGTALGCGGYAVALLVYIFNQGRYHPMVRPALLTSLLGYGMAGFAIVVDVGRYWNLAKVVLPWEWNLSSVLLEVAICVMTYLVVLAIELSPALLEHLRDTGSRWKSLAEGLLPKVEKSLVFFIALGILLPTMHQSSLGAVMLVAHQKLHPLWHTGFLPLLFLLSCIAMGYGAVILESILASRAFGRPMETPLLQKLGKPVAVVLFAFLGLRIVDILIQGRLSHLGDNTLLTALFVLEMALFLFAALVFLRGTANPVTLMRAAMVVVGAGALYRFDTYIVAFNPGPGWAYVPAVPELLATIAIVAAEILLYIAIVKRFPILADTAPAKA